MLLNILPPVSEVRIDMVDELTSASTKDGVRVEHVHPVSGKPTESLIARAWWCSECQQEICPGCYRGKRCPHWPQAEAV